MTSTPDVPGAYGPANDGDDPDDVGGMQSEETEDDSLGDEDDEAYGREEDEKRRREEARAAVNPAAGDPPTHQVLADQLTAMVNREVGMGDPLVNFLRARLDDDERAVRKVLRYGNSAYAHGPADEWLASREVNNEQPPYYDRWVIRTDAGSLMPKTILALSAGLTDELDAEHLARFGSPRRVLAELDAKRRLLEWLTPVDRTGMAGVLLRTLALPYASHTDFRDEWRLP